jgi:hypothetical protein
MSRKIVGQTSGHLVLAKLTDKINHHSAQRGVNSTDINLLWVKESLHNGMEHAKQLLQTQ